jgi:hypothetical protein
MMGTVRDAFLDQAAATFMVFSLDGALVGVPTETVESVLADPERPAVTPGSDHSFQSHADGVTRLLVLSALAGQPAPVLRTAGGLRVASLTVSQIVELPRLCQSPGSAIVGVALSEEQVLFLILDPYRLASSSAETSTPPSVEESL